MGTYVTTLLVTLLCLQACNALSYYEHYVPDGVVSAGLVAEGETFTLNNKDIKIFSGAFHYFRVHPDHWRDTLRKMRAAGLNTVETYVPWNLHEPRQGVFDFGDLGEEMSVFLNVAAFIQTAYEEDLFVIFRPGPYICGEWEFGGMPSWLLRDHSMQVRTYYDGFTNPLQNYFNNLLPPLVDFQFTRGGPIIAVQIENEYGNFQYDEQPADKLYLEFLKDTLTANGFDESLYFTSDSPRLSGDRGSLPGVLMTANFQDNGEENLDILKQLQPDRPMMVMEYWTGWFDHWLAPIHSTQDPADFGSILEMILLRNASVNMYMFIGGTNFGFMSGANSLDIWPHYAPQPTSYDYDAPLTEAGDYTEKYAVAKDLIARFNPLEGIVTHPDAPAERTKAIYASAAVVESLDFPTLLLQQSTFESLEGPIAMELLPVNDDNGQSYGYVVYTTQTYLTTNSTLFIREHVRDMAQVLVDGVVVTSPFGGYLDVNGFGWWNGRDQSMTIVGNDAVSNLTIMVENLGRVNFGKPHKFEQKKGLWEGPILVDDVEINQWLVYSLELKGSQVTSLSGWVPFAGSLETPALYRATFDITGTPEDTFLDMRTWNKGVVFLNGFNLGRYWKEGPPKTLYIPAPLLKEGTNELIAFEQYTPGPEFVFTDTPILS